MVKIRICGGFS